MSSNSKPDPKEEKTKLAELKKSVEATSDAFGKMEKAFARFSALDKLLAHTVSEAVQMEQAFASLQATVGVSSKDFDPYREQVMATATTTKTSAIEMAQAFERLSGMSTPFEKTPENMARVAGAASVLAKALQSDLSEAAQVTASVLDSFSFDVGETDRVINALAAGQLKGGVAIGEMAASFRGFGATARTAGVSLEESVALVQTLGKASISGAGAGQKLGSIIERLSNANIGFANGQFNMVDALAEARFSMSAYGTEQEKQMALQKMFGKGNEEVGQALMDNFMVFQDYAASVAGTNSAYDAAASHSDTLAGALAELSAAWTNMIAGSDGASLALSVVKHVLKFVADNMDLLVFATTVLLGVFATLKGVIMLASATLTVMEFAINAVIAAQKLWHLVMNLNPIGLIVLGIVALIALVSVIIAKWDEWGAALTVFLGPLGTIISLFHAFYSNWSLIVEAFRTGGIVDGLLMIGKTILDTVLMPLQQLLSIAAKFDPTGVAARAAAGIEKFRSELGLNVSSSESTDKAAVNPVRERQDYVSREEQKQHVSIDIRDQTGRASMNSDNSVVPVYLTSTKLANYGSGNY